MNTSKLVTEKELQSPQISTTSNWHQWLLIIVLVYLLLVAVGLIGSGFKLAAGSQAKELFYFATNPIVALVIGTVATALIQSSSTVTSIIVGLVAGGLPVSIAIPMVMGANIGTTITNTIVSIGHIKKNNEFQRAFAAATIHDFFNLLSVVIFLPLEIAFGFLEHVGAYLAQLMLGTDGLPMKGLNFIKPLVKPVIKLLHDSLPDTLPVMLNGSIMVAVGIFTIFIVITLIGKVLKVLMIGKAKQILHSAVGKGPLSGILSGTAMTILVQSSSTTTSLIIPFAGNGIFRLKQIYPFTLGANIGTCITALLAATAVTGANAIFALQIALIHLLYNLFGVIVIYGVKFLRYLPIRAAQKLAAATVNNKLYAVVYITSVFFIVPALLIGISQLMG